MKNCIKILNYTTLLQDNMLQHIVTIKMLQYDNEIITGPYPNNITIYCNVIVTLLHDNTVINVTKTLSQHDHSLQLT